MTLDQVVLSDTEPDRTPKKIRIAIHGQNIQPVPEVGTRVILTAHLSPPQGPVEPGGFDFQRRAWFRGLGAVGYTRTPVLRLAPPGRGGVSLGVTRLRFSIGAAVRAQISGDAGGFAAAITTGDRSGISRPALDALRASNLAHLLAISGLHMGLLTGFVFAALRVAIALVPALALRVSGKKIAAVGALGAGAFYLALSGGSVATERAFVMVGVMLGAILFDRRALTLRAVALAATIILVIRPESLIEPGFQMSFAATTALVSTFRFLSDRNILTARGFSGAALGLFVSSAVAGAATAPFAAAHFNQIAHYGLLANLLSVPLMGVIVMPAAVVAAVLAPVGLGWLGLEVMRLGVLWILGVAEFVAGLGGALSFVPSPGVWVLPLIALGAIFFLIWTGRSRTFGVAVMVAGFLVWSQAERPDILISGTGGLVGVKTEHGRVISKPRGEGFVALSWLENDGDKVAQITAATRAGFEGPNNARAGDFTPVGIAHVTGKRAVEKLVEACAENDLVVTNIRFDVAGCDLYDASRLKLMGATAIYFDENGPRVVSARAVSGNRLWNSQ
jgi:competence protein ComEC